MTVRRTGDGLGDRARENGMVIPSPPRFSVADIADGGLRLSLEPDGSVAVPLAVVDLTSPPSAAAVEAAIGRLAEARTPILVGVAAPETASAALPLAERLSFTLAETDRPQARPFVAVTDPEVTLATVAATVAANTAAAMVLRDLLRLTTGLSELRDGLVAESFAYSMLLAGPEFRRWRDGRPRRPVPVLPDEPVLVERDGNHLDVRLNRAPRRNSFSREVRDALLEALELPALDDTVERVRLTGEGPAFCSGGDLDEFGTTTDVVLAHRVRTTQAVGLAIDRLGDRIEVVLHGACIGAGIEVPAFSRRVLARPDVSIRLPEISMGLVPGAGGTVSLPRRIGRWRTEYLALTGESIGLATALQWGLVDESLS